MTTFLPPIRLREFWGRMRAAQEYLGKKETQDKGDAEASNMPDQPCAKRVISATRQSRLSVHGSTPNPSVSSDSSVQATSR